MTTCRWTHGNRIELLENGEGFYPRVFEAIARARHEVCLQTFILFEDLVGLQLRDALVAAAHRGAMVEVLIDGWGSPDLSPAFISSLTDAGVRLHVYDPVRRLFGTRLNMLRRMHRKIVTVDGAIAYVGGINYSVDHLAQSGPMAKQDYAVELRGPVVAEIRDFARASVRPPPVGQRWQRRLRRRRDHAEAPARGRHDAGATVRLVVRDNGEHRTDIERHYRAALRSARERIVIANAYFFPGYRLLRDLRQAARRGVDVRLILQGTPDMPIVRTAAQLLYRDLHRAGVRIYEYCARPLHAKVALVDRHWSTVGSSNLDPTSLALNEEANVVVRDEAFNASLFAQLERLMHESCREVQPEPLTPLGAGWARLRGAVVFYVARRFPVWMRLLPLGPRLVERVEGGDGGSAVLS